MNKSSRLLILMLSTALVLVACGVAPVPPTGEASEGDSLVGAWRSQIRFNGGSFAEIKDLQFMYVFNAGGTMTESSNYDGAPPVPPAYGSGGRAARGNSKPGTCSTSPRRPQISKRS